MPTRNANATCAVILLVEDDPGDQELTRRALEDGGLPIDLRIVNDGMEALDYLRRNGQFDEQNAPFPDLILLDLNMPGLNGRDVLAALKCDSSLSRVPVVVLTTSEQEADILRSYDLGCSSYIQKPVEMDKFVNVVQQLGKYWFDVVTLPSETAATAD